MLILKSKRLNCKDLLSDSSATLVDHATWTFSKFFQDLVFFFEQFWDAKLVRFIFWAGRSNFFRLVKVLVLFLMLKPVLDDNMIFADDGDGAEWLLDAVDGRFPPEDAMGDAIFF